MWCFDQFSRSCEVTKFVIRLECRHTRECIHSWFSLHIFVNFMEKEPFTQFYGSFDHFTWSYEVAMFWMINGSLRKWSHTREWTYILCYLHVNFPKLWLIPFCFMMRKDTCKPKLLGYRIVIGTFQKPDGNTFGTMLECEFTFKLNGKKKTIIINGILFRIKA